MPAAAAVMAEELEATRQKRKKHMEQEVVAGASSESPRPPATPDSKVEFPAPVTPETLTSTAVAVGKRRKWKKQEVPAASLLVGEAVQESEITKAVATPSPSTPAAAVAATAQILEVAAEGAPARKVRRRVKLEQGHSGQLPSPVDVHPQGGEGATDGGVGGNNSVRRRSSGKPRVLTNRELLRMKIQSSKGKPLPQGFSPPVANPNYMDLDPKYCSPFGPFFEQFCYISQRAQGHNAPSLLKTPDPRARLPPRDHPSILFPRLNATKLSLSSTRRGKGKEKKIPEKKMNGVKKSEKKSPSLSAAESCSDKYCRLPLDQLVPAPRSPHNLLQEEYAHDPWKVMVICIFLNCTTGRQVKKILDGFFERYPDAQTASTADLEKMAEYLAPLGLQHVKADRIQGLSKGYVEEEWTYVTQLYGVGKYAADAYAIFCAGRATEVVPEDHKLVHYWSYVCKLAEAKQNVLEAAAEAGELRP